MGSRTHATLLLAITLLSARAVAAEAPETSRIVHAGHLLAVPGQPMRGPSTLVVRGGRIDAVHDGLRSAASLGLPADTEVVDLSRRYVLPGLIDSHVHLRGDTGGNEGLLEGLTRSDAAGAYNTLLMAQKTLRAGFTTVRNLGDGNGATLALRDAVNAGALQGPRIVDAGRSLSATSGHMDGRLGLREELVDHHEPDNLCDGADACRKAVRTQVGRGVDVIKFASTGGVNSRIGAGLSAQVFDDEARAIIETAHLYGKKVAVHAHGDDGIAMAVKHGVDSVEHGTLMSDATAQAMARRGVYYVPTLSTVNGYKERLAANPNAYSGEVLKKIQWRIGVTGKSLAVALRHGVKIAFGTDAGVSKHGRNADEFELLVQYGMTPMQAIQAATVNAADLLGLAKEVGTLEAGKAADLIAVDADPLADVRALKTVPYVMKAGRDVR